MRDRNAETGIFLVRAALGFCFLMHGLQKSFGIMGSKGIAEMQEALTKMEAPMPQVMAYAVSFGELAAGIALLIGFFHRAASVLVILIMAGAIIYAHSGKGYFAQDGGMEYNIALIAMASCIFFAGPGALAYKIEKKKN